MKKHTPGPWEADQNFTDLQEHDRMVGGIPAISIYGDGGCIAVVFGNAKGPSYGNTNLIVAAPDLLAALRRLLDDDCPFQCDTETCECGEDGAGNGGTCEHIQARRAIAKATRKES